MAYVTEASSLVERTLIVRSILKLAYCYNCDLFLMASLLQSRPKALIVHD